MRIIKHSAPRLSKTTMVCDNEIDPKLLKHEAVKVCYSKAFFCPIIGRMGAGKTSILISMIKSVFKRVFHDIFVIIPSISLTSIAAEDNVFSMLPEENIYNEFTEETMTEIENRVMDNSREGCNTLLIIDDFGSQFKDLSTPENKILKKLVIKIRHLRCSMFLLCQNIFQLPKATREVATSILFYDLGVSQNEKLVKEYLPFNQKQCGEIIGTFQNPHDYILFDTRSHRVFKNLNEELVFEEEKTDI
jgi:hypothetical protein